MTNSGFQVAHDAPHHYQGQVERFMTPFVDHMVGAAVREGNRVLDVACGTGFATLAAARIVGPTGQVVGTDINPGMLTMAKTVAAHSGFDVEWREASALELPYEDDTFDSVICQQGLQFFPDPSAGLGEMARVVRQGAVIALTVWTPIEDCPFFDAERQMIDQFAGPESPFLGIAFPPGGAETLQQWFNDAGLPQVQIELVESSVALPPLVDYVPAHLKALPSDGGYFELSSDEQAAALDNMSDRLSRFRTPVGFDIPFRSYTATARF